tara:strand:+ start:2136 stop:3239 length:1104 start_codon:yes stop_codon:yes gene_type:complete
MRKGLLIFSGFNMRAVVSFIRTLEKNNLLYGVIAKSEDDEIFKTQYSNKVVATRGIVSLDIDDILLSIDNAQITLQFDEYIIAPSTEALNRFILENIFLFNAKECIFPTVSKELYERVSDKYSFEILCAKFNIRTPKEYISLDTVSFPFIAKPKKYFSINKETFAPQIISNKLEYNTFISNHNIEEFYFQEYIDGKCIYLHYYFNKEGGCDKFSQENLLQQEDGKSMLVAKSTDYHNTIISKEFEELFLGIKFRGLVMIEVKLKGNRVTMIEANPRFWGPSQLFIDSKANLFESFLVDYGILTSRDPLENNPGHLYFWDDGVSSNISSREKLGYHNYSKKDFLNDLTRLNKIEIFNRKDTFNLYKND